jgi:hypothetical protein
VGTRALELLNRLGVEAVYEHDVALANRLAAGLGMPPSNSAIVALDGRAVQSDWDARHRCRRARWQASCRATSPTPSPTSTRRSMRSPAEHTVRDGACATG